LKRELCQIFLKEIEFPDNVLVTITRVETLPNLSEAEVYISAMPESKRKRVLQILNSQIYKIQQIVNHKLRIRRTPKIRFCEEEEVYQAAKIEEILEKIKKKP
jgi:ribosome-binding factor A